MMPVVYGVDDRYVAPLCVAIGSLARSCRADLERIRVVVIHEGVTREALIAIAAAARATSVRVQTLKTDAPDGVPVSRWPSSATIRLRIATVLADEPMALYLDSDVLVLSDLRPLLTTNLGSAYLGAVIDPLSPTVGGDMLPGWRQLGMSAASPYFNSGVMLLNLQRWRADKLGDRCIGLLAQHPEYFSHPDQDVLNYLARESWVRLDSAWNAYAASALDTIGWLSGDNGGLPRSRLLEDEEGARILHFAGPLKPWLPGFPDGPALERYRACQRMVAGALGQLQVVTRR
jgi:lipopolysaccharide biosynthesis glycosyltransferase